MPVCALPDGAVLTYADDGAGAPILLVHGWAAHGGFFRDLHARLACTHRVLTPTLRGHLGSDLGSAALTVETLAADIAHFAAALDLKPTAVIELDTETFGQAANNGQMIEELSAKAKAAPQFRDIALALTKRPSPKVVKKSALAPLLEKLKFKR